MITISKPLPSDAEGINEVIKKSWYATYVTPEVGITKKDIDLMYEKNEARQIEVFRSRALNLKEGDFSLVVKENAKVVGFLRLVDLEDHVRVRTFYVDPDHVGKGIGTSLWEEALTQIPKNKAIIAWPTEHTKSIDFYRKLGFKLTGDRQLDEEVMEDSGTRMSVLKMVLDR